MRQTRIDVLGEEKSAAFYTLEWLQDRVLWHLDAKQTTAKFFLIDIETNEIVAHAISRIEHDSSFTTYGYFSTLFVAPGFRKRGWAASLLDQVESWFRAEKMPKIVYNTAENHSYRICIFERKGYRISHHKKWFNSPSG